MRIEALIHEMRAEQREDHAILVKKVDDGFTAATALLNAHAIDNLQTFAAFDKRLVPIESMRTTTRWSIGAVFSALVAVTLDVLLNYTHHK